MWSLYSLRYSGSQFVITYNTLFLYYKFSLPLFVVSASLLYIVFLFLSHCIISFTFFNFYLEFWSFCRLNLGYLVLLFQGLKMFIWGVEDLYPLFVILTLLCSQRKWKATFRTWSRFNFWKLICFICCVLFKSLFSLFAYFLSLYL